MEIKRHDRQHHSPTSPRHLYEHDQPNLGLLVHKQLVYHRNKRRPYLRLHAEPTSPSRQALPQNPWIKQQVSASFQRQES
jgi:hypothetical protein